MMIQRWPLLAILLVVPVLGQQVVDLDQQAAADAAAPPLVAAAKRGDLPTVTSLLAKGENVNQRDGNGQTALMVASSGGHVELVQTLLAKGADVNAKTTKTIIRSMSLGANFSGSAEIDSAGSAALMFASKHGHTPVVEALLAKGADVNSKDEGGYTALIMASLDQLAVVKLLLAKGADVNAVAKNGTTALTLASKNASPDSASIRAVLIKAGAR